MIERKLDDIAVKDSFWARATADILTDEIDYGFENFMDFYARFIAVTVLSGNVSSQDIRDEAQAFNDLDAQAVDKIGSDFEVLDGADYVEAMARRITHHILRNGLNLVKTQRRMAVFRNSNLMLTDQNNDIMPGMGGLELHDIRTLREEAEKVELRKD